MKKINYEELFSYLMVGILTTVVSLTIYFLLTRSVLNPNNSIELQFANVISWIISVIFAFFMNRKYVFKSTNNKIVSEGVNFCSSRVLTLFLDMLTMFICVSIIHMNDKIAKFISQIIIIVVNYITSKFIVFSKNNNNVFNTVIKSLFLIITCSIVGTILLISVYFIPTKRIIKNAGEASIVFKSEGTYKEVINYFTNSRLDNFTDSLILGEAIFDNNENIINKSMYVYRNALDNPVDDFINYVNNKDGEYKKSEYSRYWHGNLVFVKTLFLIFNYSQIRVLNIFIQTILLIYMIHLMINKGLSKSVLNLIISIFLIFPFVIGMSIQFSSVYYIFLISSIIILKYNDYIKNNYIYLFMMIGISTSYLDLLTFPVLTLGMSLILYYMLNNNLSFKEMTINIIKFSIFWGLGYLGMWLGKWIIGSILCRDNLFTIALENAKYRSSADIGRIDAIVANLRVYFNKTYFIILLPIILYYLYNIIKNIKNIKKNMIISCIPLVIISIIPLVWYFIMSQHSLMHYWFTNKSLIISIFSWLCILQKITKESRIYSNK